MPQGAGQVAIGRTCLYVALAVSQPLSGRYWPAQRARSANCYIQGVLALIVREADAIAGHLCAVQPHRAYASIRPRHILYMNMVQAVSEAVVQLKARPVRGDTGRQLQDGALA